MNNSFGYQNCNQDRGKGTNTTFERSTSGVSGQADQMVQPDSIEEYRILIVAELKRLRECLLSLASEKSTAADGINRDKPGDSGPINSDQKVQQLLRTVDLEAARLKKIFRVGLGRMR